MKTACLILAALAVGASAAATVAPARHNGGGRRRPVTCPDQQCTVAAGGTCGTTNCMQCFPTFATDTAPTNCDAKCSDANCLRCNITNAAQCLECANDGTDPFYVDSEGKCVECAAQNCASRGWERRGMVAGGCRADGFCKKCAKGFGRDASNNCVACDGADGVENCAVCSQDDATVCYRCKPGFFWDATGKTCSSCDERVPAGGCANCPAPGVCRECMSGYANVWNRAARTLTCTPCTAEGCARCEPNGNTCIACQPKDTETGQFWVYDQVSRACYGPFVDSA